MDRRSITSRENGKKGGKPVGTVASHTLEAATAKKRIVERVVSDIDGLYNAQKLLAVGSQVLMCQPKKGKTYIVEDTQFIIDFIDGKIKNDDDRYFFMTLIKPENNAIDSLLDRGLGKTSQPISGDKENPLVLSITGMQIVKDGTDLQN